jgi:hypothetical protein
MVMLSDASTIAVKATRAAAKIAEGRESCMFASFGNVVM